MIEQQTLFIQHFSHKCRSLEYYQDQMQGYQGLKKAFSMTADQVIEEVKISYLRGRGGAGFPTGQKWSFIPKNATKPKYIIANADESEPGTFKDRDILRYIPHNLIEGIIIGGYAIGAHQGYIYIRGEYKNEAYFLQEAITQAREKGYLGKNILGSGFDFELVLHRGAGAYICGEETALLNSLEGKRGEPRVKPPFPAISGAFGGPTIVNNVETLANIPHILTKGGEWFAKLGHIEKSGGTRLFCISGHVKKPGLVELRAGSVSLRQLIYDHCGGIIEDKRLKAVIPGGSSSPILTPDEIDVIMDIEPLKKIGSMLGSAGIMVIAEGTNMVDLLTRITHFYAHESCGQCTPCREGCQWMEDILKRILQKKASLEDLQLLGDVAQKINGKTLCALGDAAAWPVLSFISKFKADFEAAIRGSYAQNAP